MYSNKTYIKIIILLIILLILGMTIFHDQGNKVSWLKSFNSLQFKDTKMEENGEELRNSGIVKLPILPGEKDVLSSLILYFFQAPVKEFTKQGEDYRLVLDTTNKKIPIFDVIVNHTQISRLNAENPYERPLPATVDEITKGTIVQVGANYDFIAKIWTVGGITIVSAK